MAEVIERTHYLTILAGRPLPFGRSLGTSLKFLGVVLLVNAFALPLVLLRRLRLLIFLVANAYLLGREYFAMAALRHHDEATVTRLRIAQFRRRSSRPAC